MRTGKHIEPHSPLDFGEPVRYRALQRLLARPDSDEVLLAEPVPFHPEVKFRYLVADEQRESNVLKLAPHLLECLQLYKEGDTVVAAG